MRIAIRSVVALCVLLLLGVGVAARAAQAGDGQSLQLTVVRTGHFVAGAESLTRADASCEIKGSGYGATMQCRAAGPAKGSYHYNTALVVDPGGTGYVIACRVPLIQTLCKKLELGGTVDARIDKDHVAIADGDKTRTYAILASAMVGVLPASEAPAPKQQAQARTEQAPAAVPAPPAAPAAEPVSSSPATGVRRGADTQESDSSEKAFAACASSSAACTMFTSEPSGAEIYVDGKFVGDTPSMIILAAGTHDLRISADGFAPWSRMLEASAGNKLTIRATLPRN
jgi:hypothetical protein